MAASYDEIRHLIASGKCGEAELQIMHSFQAVSHGNLVEALVQSASQSQLEGDNDKADAMYKLALAFFENCLSEQQLAGISALRKYAEFLVEQHREDEASEILDHFAPIIVQIAQEILANSESLKAGHSA